MAYTKNYYQILGLETHQHGTRVSVDALALKTAYRRRLLDVHPDKKQTGEDKQVRDPEGRLGWTVDDVKEAYAVLSDKERKGQFDAWLARCGEQWAGEWEREFVMGVEAVDLDDFEAVERTSTLATSVHGGKQDKEGDVGIGTGMQWIRKCRCGHELGYRISERELENAVARGEMEVLVGCEGCSLWVRVGFDVEDGG
ncbi:hypothetical protein CC78DRAFT_153835 [Lojkania enalia]|uniref:Diphthamide biosynthesis protein 4 n=1 Tax=Lojkania enalia TaxID=147567 RepID=A0A9P4KH38_9PLEO|nr:hypothetical protein CC78DRAFT_153835 [Didymosphaeria enalia]